MDSLNPGSGTDPALPPGAALEAFLARYWKDREAGTVRGLGEYLELHPGDELGIAAEFVALNRRGGAGEPAPGARIMNYRLVRELGRGGQARVFLAEDTVLGRQAALKFLDGPGARSPEAMERFRREALAASALQHPGICAVYEAGIGGRIPFIAMQYLPGETLARRIATTRAARTPATLTAGELGAAAGEGDPAMGIEPLDRRSILDAAAIVEKAARALHAAHRVGVVHRDIKPGNIMVSPDGEPTIVDFGLARLEDADPESLTRTGDLFGTPAYMSPEQITRQSVRVDLRSDIWSLGVCLYEATTLRRPFEAPTREALLQAILSKEPPGPRSLNPRMPRDLDVVIRTGLEKDRDRRYQTALDLAEDLRRVREHEPILARPPGPWTRASRWVRREPAVATAILLAVLLVGVAPTVFLIRELDHSGRLRDERDVSNARGAAIQAHADRLEVEKLLGSAADLHPAAPSNLPRMTAWLARTDSVLGRAGGEVAPPAGLDRQEWDGDLDRVGRLRALRDRCVEAMEEARDLPRRSIDEHRADWDRARAAIRASSRYVDLHLEPQLGLVPFRENPRTGLWEFWVLQSGVIPEGLDSEAALLRPEPAWPILLVLLPGGEFLMGKDYPGRKLLTPVGRRVAPFFISAFEVTQAQYGRVQGRNPAQWAPSGDRPTTLAHPVEMVRWFDAREFARRLSLLLPSEVQWEYACRGGPPAFSTRYWWGESEKDVGTCENIGLPGPEGRDTWSETAPVGSFRPNGFGLHDMAGNITEWCASRIQKELRDIPEAPEFDIPESVERIDVAIRGSNYNSPDVRDCSSSARFVERPDVATPALGFRVSRALDAR